MGYIRLHIGQEQIMFYQCENPNCDYNKIDDVYSWKHFDESGWRIKYADTYKGKKASGINSGLKDTENKMLELYCPKCGVL